MSKDSVYVKLVDEKGLEWFCTVDSDTHPYHHLKLGGKWMSMVRAWSMKSFDVWGT
jgi:hypothetical protein